MAAHNLSRWGPGVSAKWCAALPQLLEAHHYSQDLAAEPWSYAVELISLREAGLTANDLRWLGEKGYVLHGHESSDGALPKEQARSGSCRVSFAAKSCFILTPAGITFATEICGAVPLPAVSATPSLRKPHPQLKRPAEPRWDPARRM